MDYSKVVTLHEEVENLYKYIQPTPTEQRLRGEVIERIEKILKRRWPETVVEPFGSYATGLYLPTSNIDLAVIGKWKELPLFEIKRELLDEDVVDETRLTVYDDLVPPMIELIDNTIQTKVNIYFNGDRGIMSTKLIKSYIELYPVLPKIICIMKQFLHQRGMAEVRIGGLTAYCMTLMCISFMQTRPRFNSDDASLGVLLVEFLQMYGPGFDYINTGITINNGGAHMSKRELQITMKYDPKPSSLCIVDPIEPTLNAGKYSFGILEIQRMFTQSLNILMKSLSPGSKIESSFIQKIIKVAPETILYRKWLEQQVAKRVTNFDFLA